MSITIEVTTYDPNSPGGTVTTEPRTFDNATEALAWQDSMATMPGIAKVEDHGMKVSIFLQQKVWVGTVVDTDREPHDPPSVYVSETEKGLHDVIRAQNGIPEDYGTSAYFEDEGVYLHVDSYYVE